MTRRGWQPLVVTCIREVWSTEEGRLEFQHHTYDALEEAPPRYRGPLPSFDAEAYCKRIQDEIDESREQRGLDAIVW